MSLPYRVSEQLKSVVLPFDARVRGTIPHARVVYDTNKDKFIVIPHKPSEVKLLNNLGYKVPSPILTHYDWCKTTPYAHQKVTAGMMSTEPRCYTLNGLGSGKTRSALFAADYLMRQGEVHKALVVAPLSTLSPTWEYELFQVMPHRSARVVHGTRDQRYAALEDDVDFYIVNTDGVFIIEDWVKDRDDIDLVIIDELANFRNARTRRWRSLNKIVKPRPWVWGMTGLVTPNGPTDAWAQTRLLTPNRVPKYFKAFQATVEYQITTFKWKARPEANDIIHKAMQPAVRFETKDCIDLPPTSYSTRFSDLNKDQAKAYKELVNLFYTQYQGEEINAANAGVKTAKLLQVACGFMYSEVGVVNFPHNEKLNVLKEIINETEQKVLVMVPFTNGVDLVYNDVLKYTTAERITGSVSKSKRDMIFSEFRTMPDPRVLVAHPGTLSHGLTLTEASVVVWFSPTMSYETYEQANARIVRPGQKFHTHIVNMESCKIEKMMFARLMNKADASNVLLDMFAELTRGKH